MASTRQAIQRLQWTWPRTAAASVVVLTVAGGPAARWMNRRAGSPPDPTLTHLLPLAVLTCAGFAVAWARPRNVIGWLLSLQAARPRGRAVRFVTAAVGATLLLASCSGPAAGPPHAANTITRLSSTRTPAPIRVAPPKELAVETTYLAPATESDGEESGPVRWDVLRVGAKRLRLTMQTYHDVAGRDPDERMVFVWDGTRLLVFDSQAEHRYVLYEAPQEHPDTWSMVEDWLSPPPAPLTGRTCTAVARSRSIIGRPAVGYSCRYAATAMSDAYTGTLWVDRMTGSLLREPYISAQRLVDNARVDETTFSTAPPKGVAVSVVAARTPPPGQRRRAPQFTLDQLGGGHIASADLAGKPYVLVFIPSDLAIWSADIVRPILALQRLTAGGRRPTVIAVEVGERMAKPGLPPPVPHGVALRIGYDDKAVLQHGFGLQNDVGFAFVGSDGSVIATIDRAASTTELRRTLAALR